jgi:pilus assembly protein CpaB
MNGRTRTIAVLAIALVTASIAAFVVYKAITRIPVREVEVANYHVVVAAKSLGMGARLSSTDVKLIPWPAKSPIANAFTDVKDVVDRGLLASVLENEPITAAKLAPLAAGAGLPPSIPPGMRAMSVKVNEVVGVAGFVVPGTKVDILVTLDRREESVTRTVVSNVQVLTAGTNRDQEKARDGEPIDATVVTLMVTPLEAEKITLAQEQGKIMLALRNPLDTETIETTGVRTAALLGQGQGTAPAVERAAPKPSSGVRKAVNTPAVQPPADKPYTVEGIRGGKRTEDKVVTPGGEVIR